MKDWYELEFFKKNSFQKIISLLNQELKKGKKILPTPDQYLNALALTPFNNVKVVIIGQDPYPTEGPPVHAMGLAFSVHPDVKPLPRSLQNIFIELVDDLGEGEFPPWEDFPKFQKCPRNGDLSAWAEQGVLLLNTSLTVVAGKAGSHSDIGWFGLVLEIIRTLNEEKENLVFILWGNHSRKFEKYVDPEKHLVLKSAHPSPLSANKGFFGSKPFSTTNKYLLQHNISPIDWTK